MSQRSRATSKGTRTRRCADELGASLCPRTGFHMGSREGRRVPLHVPDQGQGETGSPGAGALGCYQRRLLAVPGYRRLVSTYPAGVQRGEEGRPDGVLVFLRGRRAVLPAQLQVCRARLAGNVYKGEQHYDAGCSGTSLCAEPRRSMQVSAGPGRRGRRQGYRPQRGTTPGAAASTTRRLTESRAHRGDPATKANRMHLQRRWRAPRATPRTGAEQQARRGYTRPARSRMDALGLRLQRK